MISSICYPSESKFCFKIKLPLTQSFDFIWLFVVFLRTITLKPGDVILTGTPSGVGMHRKPSEFLAVGDIIESEIQLIGKIRNTVVADTA